MSKKKNDIKEKVISAFTLFVLFIVFLVIMIIAGYIVDDAQQVTEMNRRFELIDSSKQNKYTVYFYKEKGTESIWLDVTVPNSDEINISNKIKVTDTTKELRFTYDIYSDCLIINNKTTNESYIYFKDTAVLQLY